jgi:hypothetical protein
MVSNADNGSVQDPNVSLAVPPTAETSRSGTPYSASLSDLEKEKELELPSKEGQEHEHKDEEKGSLKLAKTHSSVAKAVRSPAVTLTFVVIAIILSVFLVGSITKISSNGCVGLM